MTPLDEIQAVSGGAQFFRADMHIHSFGVSNDVKDAGMTPDGIVDRAVREGLSIIAITDHNEIGNIERAITAAIGKPLLVIPGVELTTPQGHLLVYFERFADLSDFYGKLDFADRGTSDSRCQTSMLNCLKLIDPAKGFGLLAHVDGGGGFEEIVKGYPPSKADIICCDSLLGIELRSATSVVSYSASDPEHQRAEIGKKRASTLGLGKQTLARVLFSDSHTLDFLGKNAEGNKKLTRIKMDSCSFNGIRVALQDPEARIRLEDEIPQSVPHLMGIKITGGFLDGQVIALSNNLTCIIGGRGAGKSTAFEAARVIAPSSGANKLIDSEVWPDRIDLVWVDQTGQNHTLIRRIGEETENVNDPAMGLTIFPVESYGQGDTAETSNRAQTDPSVLLTYLDQFTDIGELTTQENTIRDELLANQAEIEKALQNVARIPEYKKLLAVTEDQLKALETAKGKEIVILERKIADERTLRANIERCIGDVSNEANSTAITDLLGEIAGAARPEDLRVGQTEFKEIIALIARFASEENKARIDLSKKSAALSGDVKKQIEQWKLRERTILADIEQKKAELLKKGVKLDSMYIKKLATDEASYKTSLKNLATWEVRLKDLQRIRTELLKKRTDTRAAISRKRVAFASKANSALKNALTDLFVDVQFLENALSSDAEEIIKTAMGWRTSQVPRAALLVEQVTVPKLIETIRKKDVRPLLAVKAADKSNAFNSSDAQEIVRTLGEDATLFRLQRCEYDDLPRIRVTKKVVQAGGTTTYPTRDFSRLSLGQQQSILLALMLASDSTAPLFIDQPEDNLDSEFIFHSLVPVLRAAKERRQVVIVTHNPNIAVLGDAELIIALKSTSDKASIAARGSIDETNTKKLTCQILEGAEEAFRRRAIMYNL